MTTLKLMGEIKSLSLWEKSRTFANDLELMVDMTSIAALLNCNALKLVRKDLKSTSHLRKLRRKGLLRAKRQL